MSKTINFDDVSEGTYVKYSFVDFDKPKIYYGFVDKKHIDNRFVSVRWFNHEYHTFEQPMAYRIEFDPMNKAIGDWEIVNKTH